MKKLGIVQSNYIPWKGYFDFIASVDEFILYDDAQYTRRDWRNRNIIKTANGPTWLTIPVEVKGKFLQQIRDTKVADPAWGKPHWKTITMAYSKAPFFKELSEIFAHLFLEPKSLFLSDINFSLLKAVCGFLEINTKITWSMNYKITAEDPSEKLAELCTQAGAREYISGPLSKNYMSETPFEKTGITVKYFSYDGYPEYNQLYPPFTHQVSILDLIFNEGPRARNFMLLSKGKPESEINLYEKGQFTGTDSSS